MNRHMARRAPKETMGFSWGRFPTDDGRLVTYRLYRRDHKRVLHMHVLTFFDTDTPAYIAGHLRRARKDLRDRVDEVDLAAMGVAA